MADIFVSEILILVLLIFPLLRPFSRFLKKMPAISLLPVISLVLCFLVVYGQGIYISLLPVLIFTVLVFISEIKRFFRFFQGLTNESYSIPSLALRFVLLILLGGVIFSIAKFSPENYYPVNKVAKTEEIILPKPFTEYVFGHFFIPQNELIKNDLPVILVIPNVPHAISMANTITRFFVQEEYPVIELTDICKKKPWNIPKGFKNFQKVLNIFFNKSYIEKYTTLEFDNFISSVLNKYASQKQVFVFSEGIYNDLITKYATENPSKIAGVFIYSSKDYAGQLSSEMDAWSVKINADENIKFLPEVGFKPICLFVDNKADNLPGMAELRGDDPLGAILLGSGRNIGRAERIKLAKVFEKWIYVRGNCATR